MAISRIASQDAQGTSTAASSVSATYAATPTANNLLIAIVGDSDGSNNATAISGWSKAVQGNVSTANEVTVFYKVATGAESTTVTATTSATVNADMAIHEYSGLATSSPLDKTANAGSSLPTSSTGTGTTPTTTVVSELLIVAGFCSGIPSFTSWSNSFNLRDTVSQTADTLFTGDQIVSATGAYTSTLTITTTAVISTLIATFKAKTVGTSPLSILGAG